MVYTQYFELFLILSSYLAYRYNLSITLFNLVCVLGYSTQATFEVHSPCIENAHCWVHSHSITCTPPTIFTLCDLSIAHTIMNTRIHIHIESFVCISSNIFSFHAIHWESWLCIYLGFVWSVWRGRLLGSLTSTHSHAHTHTLCKVRVCVCVSCLAVCLPACVQLTPPVWRTIWLCESRDCPDVLVLRPLVVVVVAMNQNNNNNNNNHRQQQLIKLSMRLPKFLVCV